MAQATLKRVLEQIKTLEPAELQSVERAIEVQRETTRCGYSPDEWRAMQALLQAGLLTEIKPRRTITDSGRRLIRVDGKPVSETIIEERR